MISLRSLITLGAVLAVKHYLADFIMQTNWMARGKEQAAGWEWPLLCHALCHGGLTLLIALAVAPALWWLAPADLLVHFAIDRGKATLSRRLAYTPSQPRFWALFGLDQLLHTLTNLAILGCLLAD